MRAAKQVPLGYTLGCAQLKVPPQGADEVFHPQAVPPIPGGVSRHLPKPPSGRLWRDLIIAHASNTPAPTSTPHQRQRRKRYKQSPEPTTTPTVPILRNQHRQICTYLSPRKEVLKRSFKWRFWLLLSPGTKVTRARERETLPPRARRRSIFRRRGGAPPKKNIKKRPLCGLFFITFCR